MSESPVWVAGVGMTPFGVYPELSVKDLTRAAVTEALSDAGAEFHHIQAAYFGNTCQDILEGQIVVAGQMALRPWKMREAFQTMPQQTKPMALSASEISGPSALPATVHSETEAAPIR